MSVEVPVSEDESLDELFNGRIKVIQKRGGYRFSVDSILLAHFASKLPASSIVDLGTGCGIIPLILARRLKSATVVGVEVQEDLAEMAKRTVLLNELTERITILQNDLRKVKEYLRPASFDMVVCNPPFYPVSSGRINPDQQKAIARHEITAKLGDIVRVSCYLLSPAGTIVIIFPVRRLIDLLDTFRQQNIRPKVLHLIYSHKEGEGKLVVIEAVKGGNPELKIGEPVFIFNRDGGYSKEMQKIYEEI